MRCQTDRTPSTLSRARAVAVGLSLGAGLGLQGVASACALMPHSEETLAESDHQQAIFTVNRTGGSSVDYRISWEGDAEELGWVVAVPDSVTAVEDGDAGDFDRLLEETGPTVVLDRDSDAAPGCQCSRTMGKSADLAGGGGDTAIDGAPTLIGQGFTGTYSYRLLQADDAAGLADWLGGAGFVLDPDGEANIAELVAEGGWAFAAVRVQPGAGVTGGSLPPLRFQLSDQRLVFPARMGRVSDDRLMKNTFFVIAPGVAELSGWSSIDADRREIDDQDPAEAFEDWQLEVGTTRQVALRTYAGAYDAGRWLTRFDSEIEARVMRDDATFVLGGERELHTLLTGSLGRSSAPVGAALLPLGLLAVYGYRRRGAGPAAG